MNLNYRTEKIPFFYPMWLWPYYYPRDHMQHMQPMGQKLNGILHMRIWHISI